jgi:hypothetical protein
MPIHKARRCGGPCSIGYPLSQRPPHSPLFGILDSCNRGHWSTFVNRANPLLAIRSDKLLALRSSFEVWGDASDHLRSDGYYILVGWSLSPLRPLGAPIFEQAFDNSLKLCLSRRFTLGQETVDIKLRSPAL